MNSKFQREGRMAGKAKKFQNSKDKKTPRKKNLAPKKSIPHNKDDDDDSIDSYGNIRDLIDYNEEDSSSEVSSIVSESSTDKKYKKKPMQRKAAKKANKMIKMAIEKDEEEEEESEDEDYDSNSEAEEAVEEEDENMLEDEDKLPGIRISLGSFGMEDPMERLIPKRHNLKKESEQVNKFVKLISKPAEQTTIDDQIDQFKSLASDKQNQMITALERKPVNSQQSLMFKILTMNLPPETQAMVLAKYNSLQMMEPSSSEYYKIRAWLEKLTSVPIGIYKELPAKIEDGQEVCGNFMIRAQKCLADAIYGQEEAKMQILQFIATKMANPNGRGLSLLLSGPPGIGKCHAKDTPILMADGNIKLVQDIIVGDKIMGDDSNPRNVLSLGRGKDNMYDINPVKGEKYRVNSEHILCLKYSGNPRIKRISNTAYKVEQFIGETQEFKYKTFRTIDEAEKYCNSLSINNTLEISVNNYLNLTDSIKRKLKGYRASVEFPHTIPDFNPYIIGLWLGDGSSRNSMVSNQDSAVLLYLRNTLPEYNLMLKYKSQYDYSIRAITNGKKDNKLLMTLQKYNMINNKHVPDIYKINSREIRLQVLAGLIDSDGSLCSGTYNITTTIKQLRDDILYLSRSLGFAAYSREKNTTWSYKGEKKNGKCFSIHISGNIDEIPVKIERKKAPTRQQIKDVLVTGITVTESGYDDYYGFTLDGNHRYLMGDFTVTHNTSLIKNGIAKALDWPFQFISLGGDSDSTTYTGHQLVYEGSHCGKIVNSLVTAKSMSMILMFDELDKISQTPKGEEVQNMLIHLTDPVQNGDFEDKYLSGIPIDLSKVLFAFSGNDLNKIDKILLDRMIVIQLQGYTINDKLSIAEKFLVSNALKEVHLDEKVSFSKEVVQYILETYAKDEPGVREFKRCIEQVVQKINMLRIFNSKDMPFHIPNFSLPFVLKKDHVDLFLKKKETKDQSFLAMYT